MPSGLEGKVVFVTGATRNHGRACALAFARAGADLLLCTRRSMEALEETAAMAARSDVRVETVRCDVTDQGDVTRALRAGAEAFGGVDVVVHAAGWRVRDPLTEMRREAWEAAMGVNVDALFHLCKAALPGMVERGWGRIITYSAGLGPFSGTNAFGRSWQPPLKMASVGFIRAIAREYGQFNVTANCVGPGNMRVERTPGQARETVGNIARDVPLKRMGAPEESAAVAVFLASEEAGYITGQQYLVNGGGHFL